MRLSVNKQLYLGFLVALVLIVVVGRVSYQAIKRSQDEARWVAHTHEVIGQLENVQKLVADMATGRRGYRTTGDRTFLQPYNEADKRLLPALTELKRLVADNPGQANNASQLEATGLQLMNYWNSLGSDELTGGRERLLEISETERNHMNVVHTLVNKMIREETGLLEIREKEVQASNAVTARILAVATILVLLIILALFYLIRRQFGKRRMAERVLEQKLHELEALNRESSEQNWILSNVAKMVNQVQSAATVPELASSTVLAFADILRIPSVAFYLYDSNEKKLTLQAATGVSGNVIRQFAEGEGIVGGAVQKRRLTVTDHIPPEYWRVESGLGSVSGKGQIVCLPLIHNEIKAVVELGSFTPFTQTQLRFLEMMGSGLAVRITSKQATDKVRSLLEKVQMQNEELENQQEELRQANEELTRQTEILQASEEELKVQEEELRQINAELEEKNEAVEIARQALLMKAEELEQTGKYKSEFLANMSHELRTPLNSVLILAKLLAENKQQNLTPKQVEYAHIIHKSGGDLLKLINDILDLSKIEAGKIEFNFEQVALSQVKEDIHSLFDVVAEEKNIRFTCSVNESLPAEIYTDKQRLEQVMKNLLSNAFKFTPAGGKVEVEITQADNQYAFAEGSPLRSAAQLIAFRVTDTGIGIARDKQTLIFEAFQQADGATNRKYGGTGLGLSISKELVKKLGGEIVVNSAEGEGSTFTLYLPVHAAAVSRKETAPVSQPVVPIPDTGITVPQTLVEDDRNNLQQNDKVMLIIEDDVNFARVIQAFSRSKNYKTLVALQGDEGLYYARRYRPSAIMLDMQLPVIDGWNLLKILKNDEALKHIPVHIISGADESGLTGNGALAYLKKPVEKEDLEKAFETISEHLSAQLKKVLVLSGEYIKDDNLHKLLRARHFDVECYYAYSVKEALQELEQNRYDCIIADIGRDIENGIAVLQQLQSQMEMEAIPIIIYLDQDISATDELRLKRISDVVIRESSHSKDRLLDEMELFLYKVQEVEKAPVAKPGLTLGDSNILKGKKVLLVDDDMRNVFALSTALEEQEMEVTTASDGKEALEYLKNNPGVEMVLMDIMMPEMDGYEAIRQIRTRLQLTQLPVIALTAKAMTGDREKSIAVGASDYITKPVDVNRLFSLMRVWLSR
jgi:signal transduction histidine kinase/CheY-like chemotaxis protein/CHASE3 domain sensor protein